MPEHWWDAWTEGPPELAGWYAIRWCYYAEEGEFTDVDYWNGSRWEEDLPMILRSPTQFASRAEALKWSLDHEPQF